LYFTFISIYIISFIFIISRYLFFYYYLLVTFALRGIGAYSCSTNKRHRIGAVNSATLFPRARRTQMWMSVLLITDDAVHTPTAPTHLEALPVPVLMDTLATDLPVQVSLCPLRFDGCSSIFAVCTLCLDKKCPQIKYYNLKKTISSAIAERPRCRVG